MHACWGFGGDGELGTGNWDDSTSPEIVQGVGNGMDIGCSVSHACALLDDGHITCWGDPPELPAMSASPVRVDGVSGVADIAVGNWYTCVLTHDQEIFCWGENGLHELGLGDGSPLWVDTPTRVDWRAAFDKPAGP